MAETDVCEKCNGTGWVLVDQDGVDVARRCECAEPHRRQRLLKKAGIPNRYIHCTLDSFSLWDPKDPTLNRTRRAVQEFVDLYPNVEKGLLLMGPVGTGKTHLAVATLTALITEKGVAGCFVDFTSLIHEIKMSFDEPDRRQRDILEPLIEAELLVVDELGAAKATPFVMDLLYYLVNTRYLQGRTSIFTTNYTDFAKAPEESLADRVSVRIRSRMFEMCNRLELRGQDYRRQKLAEDQRGGR